MAKSTQSSARAVALAALTRVDREKAYINLTLDNLLNRERLSERDRAFATELAYGTLRWRGKIDWVLGHYVKKPLSSQDPLLRNLLRLTGYQLLFLTNIPAPVVVAESVQLAKENRALRHAAGFVNAIGRRVAAEGKNLREPALAKDPVQSIAVKASHPEWMVARWLKQYPVDRVVRFAQANNERAPLMVRVNSLRCTAEELVGILASEGVEGSVSSLVPGSVQIHGAPGLARLKSFKNGLFTAQDEGSQLVAHVVAPAAGDVVWDLCSAPGTKTSHLLELMEDTGSVVAVDVNAKRLSLVEEGCRRLGLSSVQTVHADATRPVGEPGSADKVLVDAPCSGIGVLRRRPDLRWQREEADIGSLIDVQRRILQTAAALVRPGGVLVYSTCSVDAEENGANVRWFLQQNPDFKPSSLLPYLPKPLRDGLDGERRRLAEKGQIQLWPDLDGTDGFFISRFVKDIS